MRAALGFRAHSGWAALVAAAGSLDAPRILERKRVVLADPDVAWSKQPFHAAAELPFPRGETLVQAAVESTRALALEMMAANIKRLSAQGHEVRACGVLTASGKELPELSRVLASHALIHTAEGELFRQALIWAAQKSGLRVTCVREKGLDGTALQRVASLGKLIGPPWTQDQKLATIAAMAALNGA